MSAAPETSAQQIAREENERTRKLRNQWDELYAEWLINRGQADSSVTDGWDDDRSRAHTDREE